MGATRGQRSRVRRPGRGRVQEALRGSQVEGEGLEAHAGWAIRVVTGDMTEEGRWLPMDVAML